MLPAEQSSARARRAMRISIVAGVAMMLGKTGGYALTGSPAILSDAVESIIHLVAVGFAAWSLRLSFRPADHRFHYGYERVTFFSAGFEGAMIVMAAIFIISASVEKWMTGLQTTNLTSGTAITAAASLGNLLLGNWLVRTGRKHGWLIVEAHGRHVLTDSWTSFGVVAGLFLVLITGWKSFDPMVAIAVALNLLWSGGGLIWKSLTGLMDRSDPEIEERLVERLDMLCRELGMEYHGLRFRSTGSRILIDLHLLFPYRMPLGQAHTLATTLERRLIADLGSPAEVITHLESLEDHAEIHD